MKNRSFFIVTLIAACSALSAQNPLVTHMYTADPTARCYDGKLYVYPSSDVVPPKKSCKYKQRFLYAGLSWIFP